MDLAVLSQNWAPIAFVLWTIAQAVITAMAVKYHEHRIESCEKSITSLRERISRMEGRLNGPGSHER